MSESMNVSQNVKIAWFGKHFGEEPPLVGNEQQGSGTIFFSGCQLCCVFCQNYQISQEGLGNECSVGHLAEMMLDLQKQNAVNINLVSPSIWWTKIKPAIVLARDRGLNLPIVWNSNAYESVAILKELAGLVNIYLPDFKYGDDAAGIKYSKVNNYSKVAKAALIEMLKQVGHIKIDSRGLAQEGIIVRHLILPNNLDNSFKALKILADIDKNFAISLMNQYHPLYRADIFPEINREVTLKEFETVFQYLLKQGMENGWVQEAESAARLIPDFLKNNPFSTAV